MKYDPQAKAWEAKLAEEADRLLELAVADPGDVAEVLTAIAEGANDLRGADVTGEQYGRLVVIEQELLKIALKLSS